MAQTFDTSRVGGGTYELEQDANGNYKLKSVGFAQVNKLNLPDLKTSDTTTTTTTDTSKTEEKKTEVADPYKNLFKQTEDMGKGGGQDYSGVMLKTPEVKDAEVRQAGEPFNQEKYLQDRENTTASNLEKARKALDASKGASPQIMAQANNRFDQAKIDYENALRAQSNFLMLMYLMQLKQVNLQYQKDPQVYKNQYQKLQTLYQKLKNQLVM